jgi:ankyrin repeat protein
MNNEESSIHKYIENYNYEKLEEELKKLSKNNELKELINQRNFEGYTPLHCAILNKNQKCAQQLIDHGADINIPTDDGYKIKWISKNKQKGGNNKKQILGKRYL